MTDYANRKKIKIVRDNEVIFLNLNQKDIIYSKDYYLNPNDVVYIQPLRNVQLRSSNAQIYISAVSTIALISNIVLRVLE